MGNIAEALLKEGLAKCVDWSISKVNILEILKFRPGWTEAKQILLWRKYESALSYI